MLSNLKSLCPKRSLIAMALAVGMGSICATNYAYATGNQSEVYAFSHQGVVDVKSTLNDSMLYALLLALRAQAPEIETAAYHATVLSLLHEIASNTRPSANKLTDIDVPEITEGNGGIQKFTYSKNAGDGAFNVPDSELNGIRSVTPEEIKRYVNHVSCELNRVK